MKFIKYSSTENIIYLFNESITSTIIDINKNKIYFSVAGMNNSMYCQVSELEMANKPVPMGIA